MKQPAQIINPLKCSLSLTRMLIFVASFHLQSANLRVHDKIHFLAGIDFDDVRKNIPIQMEDKVFTMFYKDLRTSRIENVLAIFAATKRNNFVHSYLRFINLSFLVLKLEICFQFRRLASAYQRLQTNAFLLR